MYLIELTVMLEVRRRYQKKSGSGLFDGASLLAERSLD